ACGCWPTPASWWWRRPERPGRTSFSSPGSLSTRTHSGCPAMCSVAYLVFGDLHGLVLPAFRLAQAWSREHGVALAGLLQVADLGDSRFDRPTNRHAATEAREGGVRLFARPSEEADDVFAASPCPT